MNATAAAAAIAVFGMVCFAAGWTIGRVVGYAKGRAERSREVADDAARVREHLKRVADELEAGEKRSEN